MEYKKSRFSLMAFIRSSASVTTATAISSTNKNPWQQAMECHLSKLTAEQLAEISHPTSPQDLVTILKAVDKDAKSKKTAKFLDFLSKYTQPLQQFQGAIDVIVGTNGGIASPIWAPMKVVLILLDKNGKAYDILAGHLTLLARKLPIYEKYSQLFPSSEDLRNALAVVYTDYLDFCFRAANHFRRNGALNLLRSFGRSFEDEFKEVLTSIESNVNGVDDAVKVAAFGEQVSNHEAARREKALRWLSPSIFDTELNEFRKNYVYGTCEWIKETDEYKQWSEKGVLPNQPRLLWFPWFAGYGKSFIAHFVRETLSRSPDPVLFFFFNSKQENSGKRTAIAFLRTILYQLLAELLDPKLSETCFSILYPLVEKSGQNETGSFGELWNVAEKIFALIPRVNIVVDALDECNPAERVELLEKLVSITKSTNTFKMVITSRPELDISKLFDGVSAGGFLRLSFSKKHVNRDLRIYVEDRLQRSEKLADEELQKKIKEKILGRADGMFLYVRLMIDELEEEATVAAVYERLRNLPRSLTDYYDTVMQAISRRSASRCRLARDIFLWAITTYRPLKLQELLSALEVQRRGLSRNGGDEDVDWPLLGDPRQQIREACFPLVEILEDQTVQVVHTSVTQYLLRQRVIDNVADGVPATLLTYEISKAHSEVALVALTLLLSASDRNHPSPDDSCGIETFHSYCVMAWNRHVSEAEAHFKDHRKTLLDFCRGESKAFSNWIQARCRIDFRFKLYFRLKSLKIEPSPIHIAVYFNLAQFAYELIASGLDLEVKDETGASPLHIAAEQGSDGLVQRLLDAGANQQSRDKSGRTALHRAASRGRIASVLRLSGSDIDCTDRAGRSALFFATGYGREIVVKALLETGADPSRQSISGETPLSVAVANGHLEVVRLLLATGIQYNLLTDRRGLCHLVAARKGFTQVAEFLFVQARASVSVRDTEERTALHLAASGGHEAIVELLLKVGADANAKAPGDKTALHLAAKDGHGTIVKMLLEAGADVNINAYSGETALYHAVVGGHGSIVEMLLSARADANVNLKGSIKTPLHRAAKGGHGTIVEMLLKAGADTNAKTFRNKTALHNAAKGGHGAIVETLLRAGADVNEATASRGDTALHLVVKGGHGAIVEMLLKAGADVNVKASGETPLHRAAYGGHGAIVKMLLGVGADVSEETYVNETPLHKAIEGGHGAIVEMLLKAGSDVNAKGYKNTTALHGAAVGGHGAIAEALLKAGANINAKEAYQSHTALHQAARDGHGPVVEVLLKAGADINVDVGHEAALHLAAGRGREAIVEMLVKAGADINAKSSDKGQSALHLAVYGGHKAIVEMLLKAGADANAKSSDYDQAALHLVAESGNGAIVKMLLKAGADVNAKGGHGHPTALHLVAKSGNRAIVKMLLEAGADVNTIGGYWHESALHSAAKGGHEAIVEILLKAGADVTPKSSYEGHTALHQAVDGNCGAVVEMLVEAGANINERTSEDETPLYLATWWGHEAVVRVLLKAGADVNAKAPKDNDWTALHNATSGMKRAIVELLLSSGADMNELDRDKQTALHIAVSWGDEALVQILLEAGSDVDALDDKRRTPLHIACAHGYLGIVEELLEADADDSIADKEGKMPIDLAVERGDEAILALFS